MLVSRLAGPGQLATAVVDNLRELMAAGIPSLRGAEIFTVDDTTGYITDVKLAVFNGAVRPRLLSDPRPAVDVFIARALQRNVPIQLWLCPGSRPDNLLELLIESGFASERVDGMALDISSVQPEPLPPGLSIRRVESPDDLTAAMKICCECFAFDASFVPDMEAAMGFAGFGADAMFQTYLAHLNGRPVATSGVVYAAGVAGLYNIATLPAARGRGIGRALTLAPLLDARRRGYEYSILHATKLGFPVYERLGFRHVCDIHPCIWTPSTV